MRITGIKTFPYRAGWRDWVLLKVYTDEGIDGVGECGLGVYEHAVVDIVEDMGQFLTGWDPTKIELIWHTLFRNCYWKPSAHVMMALSGIEMALWDILGKSLSVPVYKLLGGAFREKIQVYNNAWYFSAVTPEDYARLAADTVAQGFRHLKWDPYWTADIYMDREARKIGEERVRAVREAVGDDVELLIEMHGRFSPETAILAARDLEKYNPFFIEEPIPPECRVSELVRVRNNTTIPVASGERVMTRWGFWDILHNNAVAVIQPDIISCGGILETKKVAAMAQVQYIGVAPHSACGPVLAAASMQIDACTPNFWIQEFFFPDAHIYEEILTDHLLRPKDGYVDLPTTPGLGITVDEKALTKNEFHYRKDQTLSGEWADLSQFTKNNRD